MYKHSDFDKGFSFSYNGKSYREIDLPTNNGNFHAVDDHGNSSIFNIADVIQNSKYNYSGKTADGRKRCRICGTEIKNGENGCAVMDICFTCNGGAPQYNTPCRPHYTNTAEELDILEARATSINRIYD